MDSIRYRPARLLRRRPCAAVACSSRCSSLFHSCHRHLYSADEKKNNTTIRSGKKSSARPLHTARVFSPRRRQGSSFRLCPDSLFSCRVIESLQMEVSSEKRFVFLSNHSRQDSTNMLGQDRYSSIDFYCSRRTRRERERSVNTLPTREQQMIGERKKKRIRRQRSNSKTRL